VVPVTAAGAGTAAGVGRTPDRVTGQASDAVLVMQARAGDTRAFELLHERYCDAVSRVVRSETRRSADVADLVQETFTSAWSRLGGLRDPERFRPWLFQIARRVVIDHARAMARRPVLDGDDDLTLMRTSTGDPGPDELAELAELASDVRVALDGLSRRDAVVVSLVAQFGFGPTEVAEALGITPNNAKVVVHRARRRLVAELERRGGLPGVFGDAQVGVVDGASQV
jgi:RNA polymerase sigma factor (sigma-70 family)